MPITFRNDSITPIGLWDVDNVHHVAAPLGGSVTLEPSASAQETIDIMVAAGSGSSVTVNPPVNTAAPAVSGTAEVGSTLTATDGTWTATPPATYSRIWQRSANGTNGWAAISGATATTYDLVEADDGQHIRCVVTATNTAGNASANSNVIGPVATPDPGTEE